MTDQKTKSFVYCWVRALAMVDVERNPAYVRAFDVILRGLPIKFDVWTSRLSDHLRK